MRRTVDSLFCGIKPVIGMCHVGALPGDPFCSDAPDLMSVLKRDLARDIEALQHGGIDGIMFSNESSQPWVTRTDPVTAVAMASVIGSQRSSIHVRFGVNVIWDPEASLELASAVEADFVWEVFVGTYASDFGLWHTNLGRSQRHGTMLSGNALVMSEVIPEAAVDICCRPIEERLAFMGAQRPPDVLTVAGLSPGAEVEVDSILALKSRFRDIPVFVSTGVTAENVEKLLRAADGVIVGSALKRDGNLWNSVDIDRVQKLMSKAVATRP